MGLHISRIEVRNFRNFRHLIIDDFPTHAVIVGENGVGKSNLLEAIRLVLDPALSDSRRMLREEDIWEGHPAGLTGGAEVIVALELQGFDTDDDAKRVLSAAVVDFAPYTARLTYRFAPRAEIKPAVGASVRPSGKPLTSQDYDFVVFGGVSETNDVRAIRRDVAVRVLPALRDAEGDLHTGGVAPCGTFSNGCPWTRPTWRPPLRRSPPPSTSSPRTAILPS